jgi:presenilin-like A22 family membrane protease
MPQNISSLERDARLLVGLPLAIIIMISAGITSVLGIFAAVFGLVALLTALTGYDPVYDLFDVEPMRSASV